MPEFRQKPDWEERVRTYGSIALGALIVLLIISYAKTESPVEPATSEAAP